MKRLLYGVWDEKVYDFRHGRSPAADELPALADMEVSFPGSAVHAFIADRGFLVFDAAAHVTDAFWRYLQRAAAESCGKCVPCRVGTVELRKRLAQAMNGRGSAALLDELHALATHVGASSLCGLGKSCCRALLGALTHFRDEFEHDMRAEHATPQHSTLYLTAPCIEACPSKVDVPRYIGHIGDGQPLHALGVILEKYPIAATCGRVCVRHCEAACRRNFAEGAVAIKMLKRYAADSARAQRASLFSRELIAQSALAGFRVAVVGAGPAGVTCAYHLLLQGAQVEVFEAREEAGGMAAAGIPSYRLPKDIVKSETEDVIRALGGRMHFGRRLGTDFTLDALFAQGFDAVFLGFGASKGALLGEHNEPALNGYMSGIDFLWQVHCHVADGAVMSLPGDVVVVGGGNVAMDCVRSAVRLGARNVHLVYRRTLDDMPADREEIVAAEMEGVIFHCLANPLRILSEDAHVSGIELTRMRQNAGDRRRVEAVPGTAFTLACRTVIAAIGQQVERGPLQAHDGIRIDSRGCIEVDADTLATARRGVFAGGDCVLGPQTLIQAMAHGALAARSIARHLRGVEARTDATDALRRFLAENRLLADERVRRRLIAQERAGSREIDLRDRLGSFREVEMPIDSTEARQEAQRCLCCYRLYSLVTESAP